MAGLTESQYLAQIRQTYSQLESWRDVVRGGFAPDPGSDLVIDDEDWPAWPISDMVAVGLGMAFDHLDAVRHTVETGQFFAMAQTTLLRGALIGAAQSVWLLAPEAREERLRRTRTLLDYVYSEHGKFLRAVLESESRLPEADEVADQIARRKAELRGKRTSAGERSKFTTTDMVIGAARAVLLPRLVREVEVIWRESSGVAHGLPWSLLGHPQAVQTSEPDEHGRASFVVTGGAARLANPYLAVFTLARHGWGLREMRGSSG
jgi:hypothetical protein